MKKVTLLVVTWFCLNTDIVQAQYPYNDSIDFYRSNNGTRSLDSYFNRGSSRPVLSPYLHLLRPEGVIGGLPNYYTLVRPEINSRKRYAGDRKEYAKYQHDVQQQLRNKYLQQQRQIQEQARRLKREQKELAAGSKNAGVSSSWLRFRPSPIRSTGHVTSIGIR